MEAPKTSSVLFFLLLSLSCLLATSADTEAFLQCLSSSSPDLSSVIYTPINSSYRSILEFNIENLRFMGPMTPKPNFIVTPTAESQVPPIVTCAKEHGIQIRTRSAGHDYEGISSYATGGVQFVMIDLIKLHEVTVDVEGEYAWVQTGTPLGQLYYSISQKSDILAFPGGVCPTVGVGGHISGGGYGTMMRKYGLAADNVLDARIVDVEGNIRDRETMGEDLFWAIRGGGGASFGVILAWKLQLVRVPRIVTAFTIYRTLEQGATELVYRWQFLGHTFPDELLTRFFIRSLENATVGKTIEAEFSALFLGNKEDLLRIFRQSFPELGLKSDDCHEMSWIESIVFDLFETPGMPVDEVLLNRTFYPKNYFKAKSDYVHRVIPRAGFEGLWELLYEDEGKDAEILMVAYGGIMQRLSETAIPYPHRAGNLYQIHYMVTWNDTTPGTSDRHINWIRKVYDYMTPYVSSSPRGAYINYRDLDLGVNSYNGDNDSYLEASVWGLKYFNNNFKRLVQVKTEVDPDNFFRNEQSIPALKPRSSRWAKKTGLRLKGDSTRAGAVKSS